MLGGLQKSGVYTAVYTDTMERAWQATVGMPCFGCNLSSTAVDENGIYVAVTGGNLYSLDRDTGAVRWATPMTGSFRYNGLAVANGIVYSLNDATGTLQAFDTPQRRSAVRPPVRAGHRDAHERHGQLERGLGGAQHGLRDGAGGRHEHPVRAEAGRDRRGGDGGGEQPPPEEEPPPPATAASPRPRASSPPAPARRATGT